MVFSSLPLVGCWERSDNREEESGFERNPGSVAPEIPSKAKQEGADPTVEVRKTVDCRGVIDGTARLDDCGVCDSNRDNDNATCTRDCAGVWGGGSVEDDCGVCDSDRDNDNTTCTRDCAGVWGGGSVEDDCGVCDSDRDNDNTTCTRDCAGVWGGSAVEDDCGVCDADDSNNNETCTRSCTGVWGGSAAYDLCGNCDSDPSNDCAALSEEIRFTSPDGAQDYIFGRSVAISGDTAVVGAANSAYVFTRNDGSWSFQQKLTGTGVAQDADFGCGVAMSGDTIVVGAHHDYADDGKRGGSVYVFVQSDADWIEQQKISVGGTYWSPSECLISISGDTIVVGNASEGFARVYTRSDATWALEKDLGIDSSYSIISSVSVSGDTAVVGIDEYEISYVDNGAAIVFVRADTSWDEQQTVRSEYPARYDRFGAEVVVSGDTLIAATPGYDSIESVDDEDYTYDDESGAVYVFERSGASWSLQQAFENDYDRWNDGFSRSISLSGDTVAVGSCGSAYIFARSDGEWIGKTVLRPSDGESNCSFVGSIAVSGSNVLVGAPNDDTNDNEEQGSVYFFNIDTN